jgi:hypothetical protein
MLDYKNKNQAIINNVDIEDRIIIGDIFRKWRSTNCIY